MKTYLATLLPLTLNLAAHAPTSPFLPMPTCNTTWIAPKRGIT